MYKGKSRRKLNNCPLIKENEKLKAKIEDLEKKLKELTEQIRAMLSNSRSKQ